MKIFVTLGTQDKIFNRLLDDVSMYLIKSKSNDEVIVQAGFTKYKNDKMKIYDLLDKDEFDKYIKDCDLLITHGGVGSILTGIKNNKKVIACPRLAKYKEHINDHQVQIVEKFSQAGYILSYNDGDDLNKVIKESKKFIPNKYVSNTDNMVNIIENFIDKE